MSFTKDGVMEYIQQNDVKFVRLAFCDIFGAPKNVAVMAGYLPQVFEQGSGFDVAAVDGLLNIEEGDLLLFPDPTSFSLLPWRPSEGRVGRMYCDIRHPGGTPFEGDGRRLLRAAKKEAAEMGILMKVRTECEFYLFELDEEGAPTRRPHDRAGYLDIAPLDKGENVRREICLALEEMGAGPMGSHHEKGPGQHEIWCRATDALAAADDFITYKTVVRTIAAKHGLFASFMPKPLAEKSVSGLHINMSLHALPGAEEDKVSRETFQHFVAGILEYVADMTLFLNTTTNSYRRFGSFDAPRYISWARGNRSQLVRVPESGPDGTRVELRRPDPLCNPYIAFTLLLRAGMEGIKKQAALRQPADFDLSAAAPETLQKFATLPENLEQALEIAKNSLFINRCLPKSMLEKTVEVKQAEWVRACHAEDSEEFEQAYYFERI